MVQSISSGMNQLLERLRNDQSEDGAWHYPFETGISTDCYMIILLRTLGIDEENLIQQLTDRILSKQGNNGAWKLFYDEGRGNISATCEAYYALLYSGYYQKDDKRLVAAKKFILAHGGIEKVHMFTKIMLAMTGQYKWPTFFPIPLEFILLPPSFPVNFYQLSVFGRANLLPIMILADQKFSLKTNPSPDLSDLFLRDRVEEKWLGRDGRALHSTIKEGIKSLVGMKDQLKKKARMKAKQYILGHIEADGTFSSYFSSTFLMIFALIALGYKKDHPIILRAIKGLMSMRTEIDGYMHMQYTTASIWNTSLISYAAQEAGVHPDDPMVVRANEYLLKRQHHLYGDWVLHNPEGFPGGWGFSHINTFHPDVDDTTASLRAITRSVATRAEYRQSWERGILWVLSMQSHGGGWAAFEKNTNSPLFKLLPIEKAEFILTDPPSPDLTGRTLEFLGKYTNLSKQHPSMQAGVRNLLKNQESDGSWYGRWGICYIYGTWAAVTGLIAAGEAVQHSSIQKAVAWLKSIQNEDGGWEESCKSDSESMFVPLGTSTLTHTAWAVDALIVASPKPTREIERGIDFLLKNLNRKDWTTNYPKGQGMAGGFYIHYHSYRYLFPLLAFAHYQQKFEKGQS